MFMNTTLPTVSHPSNAALLTKCTAQGREGITTSLDNLFFAETLPCVSMNEENQVASWLEHGNNVIFQPCSNFGIVGSIFEYAEGAALGNLFPIVKASDPELQKEKL